MSELLVNKSWQNVKLILPIVKNSVWMALFSLPDLLLHPFGRGLAHYLCECLVEGVAVKITGKDSYFRQLMCPLQHKGNGIVDSVRMHEFGE